MVVRGGGGIAERKSENLWPFIVLWAPMWLWHNGPPGGNNTRRLRRCLKHSPYNVINDTAFPPPRPLRKEHRSFDDQNLIELAYPTSVKTRSLRAQVTVALTSPQIPGRTNGHVDAVPVKRFRAQRLSACQRESPKGGMECGGKEDTTSLLVCGSKL